MSLDIAITDLAARTAANERSTRTLTDAEFYDASKHLADRIHAAITNEISEWLGEQQRVASMNVAAE